MDRRRDVKTVGGDIQMQTNLLKMRKERSVVKHWIIKEEWRKKNVYPVGLWFRFGITKLRGNVKVTFLY